MTSSDILKARADAAGIPLISVWNAQDTLERAKRTKADVAMARAMLRHGRLTDEARAWVAREYPQ